MALPALRQPKAVVTSVEKSKTRVNFDVNYVILTLKDETKLVVVSDAYHGIIAEDQLYRCVFCNTNMELDYKYKEVHKDSLEHRAKMFGVPYVEEYPEHLIRRIDKNQSYCTICNVMLPTYSLARHITNEAHCLEIEKATTRALAYKPQFQNYI